jgi:pyrrolidone-carboxylate peptidase
VARHVFIAGFEPFGGDKIGPSEMVARSFEGRLIAGRSVDVLVFPVEMRTIRERLERALSHVQPPAKAIAAGPQSAASMSLKEVER